ncbi:hypothetical protein B9Z19DRAFT_1071180 [Tuber borchii]|uniref:Uncharacterized protein n=1 Tax=Tuber borchii TaxID=42251 RepID=A0A2T7A8C1_TUBBO|nr:hypothetical protein B9Z19DRAFT_1071180 [Tuber borchii]
MAATVTDVTDAAAPTDITSPQIPHLLSHYVESEMSITLAIIPPSRPLTPQQEDDRPASPNPSQSLSPTSPITRTRSNSIGSSLDITSDDETCLNSAATSVTDISLASNISDIVSPGTTVYHIYRNGSSHNNLSIHTAKDSSLKETLQEPDGPPIIIDKGDPIANRISKYKNRKSKLPAKKVKVEDPEIDPRKATYYMHSPLIYWHCPAQTLRFGPNKTAPIVCLVKGGWFWRTWRMDFVVPEKELKKSKKQNRVDSGFADGEDKGKSEKGWKSLNEPGVIDPRGVLACKYPLRPSGHRKGESGKKYVTEHVKRQKAMNATSDQQLKRSKSFSDMARRIFRLNPASPTSVPKDKEKATTGSETGGTAEPTTESKAGGTAEPITEPKTEGTAEPLAESKIGGTAEPTTESKAGGTAEPATGSTAEPTREEIESMLPPGPNPEDLPDHLKPETLEEGSLLMKWSGWLTREYDFKWSGTEFVWKGTGTVRDEKKYWGSLSRYNHLKLVAKIPVEPEEKVEEEVSITEAKDDKKGPQISIRRQASFSSFVSTVIRRNSNASQLSVNDSGKPRSHREVVIAKYTCLLAQRKCGRLIIYEKALQETASLAPEGYNPDVARERLRHVVVATGLCMLQGEKQKRDTMKEIAQAVLGEIGGVAG